MKYCRQPSKLKWLLKQPGQWSTPQRYLVRFLALAPVTTVLLVIAPVLC
jgi:hypothetical protein